MSFLADIEHPATLHVIAADSGHNPRAQSPAEWRPSDPSTWCAYAVDWIAVKTRWELGVTGAEAGALRDMLESCDDSDSDGADPATVPVQPVPGPEIVKLEDS